MEPRAHNEPSQRDQPSHTDASPDPILSGADAVEKTTYIADVHGADTEGAGTRGVEITAAVHADSASPIAWIAAVLALLALVAYGAALFG